MGSLDVWFIKPMLTERGGGIESNVFMIACDVNVHYYANKNFNFIQFWWILYVHNGFADMRHRQQYYFYFTYVYSNCLFELHIFITIYIYIKFNKCLIKNYTCLNTTNLRYGVRV